MGIDPADPALLRAFYTGLFHAEATFTGTTGPDATVTDDEAQATLQALESGVAAILAGEADVH